MEFHISRKVRERYGLNELLMSYAGNVIFANIAASRDLAKRVNDVRGKDVAPDKVMHGGSLFAAGLIDELSHALIAQYRENLDPGVLGEALKWFASRTTNPEVEKLLANFVDQFPGMSVYTGEQSVSEWLDGSEGSMPNREAAFEELMLLWLANINPAFAPFREFFDDSALSQATVYKNVTGTLDDYFETRPPFDPGVGTLLDALLAPMLASPNSLAGQLDYIRENWVEYLGDELRQVLLAMDILKEEDIAIWTLFHPPSASAQHPQGQQGWGSEGFEGDEFIGFADGTRRRRRGISADGVSQEPVVNEYEAFSPDQVWMPTVVLIAKSTYVWLEQLSKKYQRHIHRLDQIPDEELALLAARGLNGLWLIGLWERSVASQTIKRLRGQADAVASAYSVADYRIAEDLGGEPAYRVLRDRAATAGIRLASDMVPNHMGIDSTWVMEHPEWFVSRSQSPFPVYSFEGPDLSNDNRIEIKIEDHYFDQTDAAVVFRRRERNTGHTDFVYHGNDGTTFAWNDTAQLDYSKAVVREQVMQTILQVARLFPIIRFDAAMTLAKKHVQRLWFPLPGVGGSIPSRAEDSMSQAEFDALMPNEFWREVVDRVAVEVPGTLLLAEAFWLLEGYFVRTLGMHRVYNSAFMNMLRDEENAKYRSYLKKTIEFDPDILKRYVNFMSNPDERTAIDQFGSGDRYFGVCTLLATLPGLPMFGHGQIEAFTEKYGMEYKSARFDEYPNEDLVARHQREIAPLLKNRQLYAGSSDFFLYDFWTEEGTVDENVYAYSNRSYSHHSGHQRAIIFFNNRYGGTRGTIHHSAESMDKGSGSLQSRKLGEALHLASDDGLIVAYRDAANGLEYLRRSKDLEHHGLTLELRAYQYVVLQNWRELQSTAERPWDRLCDALNGAGVYNLEEALSKLRLRPVHEALRQLLSSGTVEAIMELALAEMPPAPAPTISTAPPLDGAGKEFGMPLKAERPVPPALSSLQVAAEILPPAKIVLPVELDGSKPEESADTSLDFLTEKASAFFNAIKVLVDESEPATPPIDPKLPEEATIESLRRAVQLPQSLLKWPASAAAVLPVGVQHDVSVGLWVPVIAFGVLTHLGRDGMDQLAFFDQLQLRSALAEIFSSLGLEGESAWRASARVRLLLAQRPDTPDSTLSTVVSSSSFWSDPDVRWLAGVQDYQGKTFFNKELFGELTSWLILPDLMTEKEPAAIADLGKILAQLANAAEEAGYEMTRLMELLQPKLPKVPAASVSQVTITLEEVPVFAAGSSSK
jgi:hypothetical protein